MLMQYVMRMEGLVHYTLQLLFASWHVHLDCQLGSPLPALPARPS